MWKKDKRVILKHQEEEEKKKNILQREREPCPPSQTDSFLELKRMTMETLTLLLDTFLLCL